MKRNKNNFFVSLFVICLTSCVGVKPFYSKTERDWSARQLPDLPVKYSVYLIGDAGEPEGLSGEVLNTLHKHLAKSDSNHITIFLGDNIYPHGLPPENDSGRKAAEERINVQLNSVMNDKGRILFIPGNHDWDKGSADGQEYIKREEEYIENKLNRGNVFLPDNGCPGPVEIKLAKDLVLIPIDTEYWLQKGDDDSRASNGCEIKNQLQWIGELKDMLDNNHKKNILVVAHHPLFSSGSHGGYFPLKEHFFPLTAMNPKLYIPLPVIGSIYPLYRSGIGSRQDIVHPSYKLMKDNLLKTFEGFSNLIYAAGHEHNLQYVEKNNQHFIISGSGSKTTWTAHTKNASFSYSHKGFVKLTYFQNGEVWEETFATDSSDAEGKVVFRKKLKDKKPDTGLQDSLLTASAINYTDSTILMAANKSYKAGAIKEFVFGKHYRSAWIEPISVPVIDIGTDHGGLTLLKKGGGMQTKSLRVRAKDGGQLTLRSVLKFPDKLLPKSLLHTFAADVLIDQISTTHPYSAYVVDDLAEAAEIFHTQPKLVYVPDDPRLGEYRADFANTLALYEQRPEGDLKEYDNFGNTKEAISSEILFNNLKKDNGNAVDEYALAKNRLFDMWINDWDRHEDQWRWATFKCSHKNEEHCNHINAENEYYVPIPRDRDQAFAKFDGLIPWVAGRKWAVPKWQTFDKDIRDVPGLNLNARFLDHALLTKLSLNDWTQVADELKKKLTDEKIESSIKKWPQNIFDIDGNEIIGKLKARREKLSSVAERYYRFLAKEVDVTGSDKKEIFEVNRVSDEITSVKVYDNKKGEKGRLLYDREFKKSETKEIRLYGLDGDDIFTLNGSVSKGIKIRIIGGEGVDSVVDNSHVNGWGKKTLVYDDKNKNKIHFGSETRDMTSDEKGINEYTRFSVQYDVVMPLAFFGYNPDDGVFIGGGTLIRHFGFRKNPYSSLQKILANVAIENGSFNFKYNGDFTDVFGKWGLNVDVSALAPKSLTNFYGLGNETEILTGTNDSYYRLRYDQVDVFAALTRKIGVSHSFKIGPVYEFIKIENTPDRFVSSEIAQPFVPDFDPHNYGGIGFDYQFVKVNNLFVPTRGIKWNFTVTSVADFKNTEKRTTNFKSDLSFYIPLPGNSVLAYRIGGAALIDDYEFFQANTLGGYSRERGSGNLRGFNRERFAGRSVMYMNADLRIPLFSFRTYFFPVQLGILGFYDQGKVWVDHEDSDKWHSGYGGGIWLNLLDRAVINASYAFSKGDEKLFNLGLGFLF